MRLVNGPLAGEGRVEIFHNNRWGTICDDSFDDADAETICSQLGYFDGFARTVAAYGEGTGQIWLDQLECNGYESSILHCEANPWGDHDCRHSEDAGVRCCK